MTIASWLDSLLHSKLQYSSLLSVWKTYTKKLMVIWSSHMSWEKQDRTRIWLLLRDSWSQTRFLYFSAPACCLWRQGDEVMRKEEHHWLKLLMFQDRRQGSRLKGTQLVPWGWTVPLPDVSPKHQAAVDGKMFVTGHGTWSMGPDIMKTKNYSRLCEGKIKGNWYLTAWLPYLIPLLSQKGHNRPYLRVSRKPSRRQSSARTLRHSLTPLSCSSVYPMWNNTSWCSRHWMYQALL